MCGIIDLVHGALEGWGMVCECTGMPSAPVEGAGSNLLSKVLATWHATALNIKNSNADHNECYALWADCSYGAPYELNLNGDISMR